MGFRLTFRNRYSPVLHKWTTCEEQAQLGADEAAANPYEKHVDELLLFEAFSAQYEATSDHIHGLLLSAFGETYVNRR